MQKVSYFSFEKKKLTVFRLYKTYVIIPEEKIQNYCQSVSKATFGFFVYF